METPQEVLALQEALLNLPEGVHLQKHDPADGLGTHVYALRYPSEADRGYTALANGLEPELAEFIQAALDLAKTLEVKKIAYKGNA